MADLLPTNTDGSRRWSYEQRERCHRSVDALYSLLWSGVVLHMNHDKKNEAILSYIYAGDMGYVFNESAVEA